MTIYLFQGLAKVEKLIKYRDFLDNLFKTLKRFILPHYKIVSQMERKSNREN